MFVSWRLLELFAENGAVQSGAKHKMAQPYWGAKGLKFGWLKVNDMSRISTKYYNPRATGSLHHFMLKFFSNCAILCKQLYIVCAVSNILGIAHMICCHHHCLMMVIITQVISDTLPIIPIIPHVDDKSPVYCGSQFLPWETGRILEKLLTVLVKVFKANANYSFWMISHIHLTNIESIIRVWWIWWHKLDEKLRRSFSN